MAILRVADTLIPPHGVHIVISGERERNTKDEKQEKWRSSRKERILFICHLFPSPHFFLMLFIFPHSHIISNAAAGADKLTHSELFGPENVCFTFWQSQLNVRKKVQQRLLGYFQKNYLVYVFKEKIHCAQRKGFETLKKVRSK